MELHGFFTIQRHVDRKRIPIMRAKWRFGYRRTTLATQGAAKPSAKPTGKQPTLDQAVRVLKPATPVFIQFMEAPSDLNFFDAVVQNAENKTITLQFLGKTPPENINNINIHYRDEKKRFVCAHAEVKLNLHTKPLASYQVLLVSPPVSADKRAAFRVSVVNLQMIAEVGDKPSCQLLDMSFDTIGAITPSELNVDEKVQVQFFYGGEQVIGQMRVLACTDRGNGTFRCGLKTSGKALQFNQKLQTVVMDIQRNQLKRLAALNAGKNITTQKNEKNDPKKVHLNLVMSADMLIGKPLPGELRDVEGNLFAKPGAVLTQEQVFALATKSLKLTSDWIVKIRNKTEKEKEQEKDNPENKNSYEELREHNRMDLSTESTVQVCCDSDKRKLTVITRDVSASGFSFECSTYIHVGSPLEMTVTMDGQIIRLSGIAMNCRLVGAPNHRVGVKLTKREILGKAEVA